MTAAPWIQLGRSTDTEDIAAAITLTVADLRLYSNDGFGSVLRQAIVRPDKTQALRFELREREAFYETGSDSGGHG